MASAAFRDDVGASLMVTVPALVQVVASMKLVNCMTSTNSSLYPQIVQGSWRPSKWSRLTCFSRCQVVVCACSSVACVRKSQASSSLNHMVPAQKHRRPCQTRHHAPDIRATRSMVQGLDALLGGLRGNEDCSDHEFVLLPAGLAHMECQAMGSWAQELIGASHAHGAKLFGR